jgi:sugar O-acyltransferase (sialic acid O-acetyltransferase NeuD family)
MPRLLIIGAGAQARQIMNSIRLGAATEILGLVDTFDNPQMWGQVVGGATVLGNLSVLDRYPPAPDLCLILAVARLAQKRELAASLAARGYEFQTVRHPTAIIAPSAVIGRGCAIHAGALVDDRTRLGDHVIVHAGAVVEHDNLLEDFVNIGTGVRTSGRVTFREGATVFTGAIIVPDIEVGREAVVSAGAVVFKSVAPGHIVLGNPARSVRRAD